VKTDKTKKIGNKAFLIKVLGQQHATWQGTITLLGSKATHTAKPQSAAPGDRASETLASETETMGFRSLLELIHLIDDALEKPGDSK
jgi:hypothetical protein